MSKHPAMAHSLFDPAILVPAIRQAFLKLDPRQLMRNPVIFVTEIVAAVVTLLFLKDMVVDNGDALFSGQIAVWLWFTVLFATFAEAVAEGRGKAQADSLRRTKSQLTARKLVKPDGIDVVEIPAADLKVGDLVIVEAGELIPGDGEVVKGVASVNESAITGESAPVIREVRRRPLSRHRRHASLVRLAGNPNNRRAWLQLRRPHDCTDRRRGTPENAE